MISPPLEYKYNGIFHTPNISLSSILGYFRNWVLFLLWRPVPSILPLYIITIPSSPLYICSMKPCEKGGSLFQGSSSVKDDPEEDENIPGKFFENTRLPVAVYSDQSNFKALHDVIGEVTKMPNDVMVFVGSEGSPMLISNLWHQNGAIATRDISYLSLLYRTKIQEGGSLPYSSIFDKILNIRNGEYYKNAMRSCHRAVPPCAFDFSTADFGTEGSLYKNGILSFDTLLRFPKRDMLCVFRGLQNSLGNMHTRISSGQLRVRISSIRVSQIRQALCHNSMLWYRLWGELDLHRLSLAESIALIKKLILRDTWNRARIVFGRGRKCVGTLHQLIHAVFLKGTSEFISGLIQNGRSSKAEVIQGGVIDQMREEVEKKNIDSIFYAGGAAVELFKNK